MSVVVGVLSGVFLPRSLENGPTRAGFSNTSLTRHPNQSLIGQLCQPSFRLGEAIMLSPALSKAARVSVQPLAAGPVSDELGSEGNPFNHARTVSCCGSGRSMSETSSVILAFNRFAMCSLTV